MDWEGSLEGELLGRIPTQVVMEEVVLGKGGKVGVGNNQGTDFL